MFGRTLCPVSDYTVTTKSKVRKIEYRWEIPNFDHVILSDDWEWDEYWERKKGAGISASGTDVHWQLRMVRDSNGFLDVEIRHDSVYTTVADSKMQIYLAVCICDANNTKVFGNEFREVPRRFMTVGNGLRYRLIKRDIILSDPPRYLPGGKLTVLCTLHYLQPEAYTDTMDQPEMVSCMGNVLNEGLFSDVIVVADEREFPVHRAILAQRSNVFRAMFEVDMAEKRDNRVVIEDLSASAISDLLTFIYTDSAPNIKELAQELLAAAEKYNIPRLKAVCETELAKCLNIDNVIDRLIESETYRAFQLKDAALQWIAKHAPDVVNTESWESFSEQHPELVAVICKQFASYIKELKQSK